MVAPTPKPQSPWPDFDPLFDLSLTRSRPSFNLVRRFGVKTGSKSDQIGSERGSISGQGDLGFGGQETCNPSVLVFLAVI